MTAIRPPGASDHGDALARDGAHALDGVQGGHPGLNEDRLAQRCPVVHRVEVRRRHRDQLAGAARHPAADPELAALSPDHTLSALRERKTLVGLAPGARYRATYVNPRTGTAELSVAFAAEDGRCVLADGGGALAEMAGSPTMFPRDTPTWEDWVLIVRPDSSAVSISQKPWQ
jgi:hypothetical protein